MWIVKLDVRKVEKEKPNIVSRLYINYEEQKNWLLNPYISTHQYPKCDWN